MRDATFPIIKIAHSGKAMGFAGSMILDVKAGIKTGVGQEKFGGIPFATSVV